MVAGGALDVEACFEAGCDVFSFCVEAAAVEAEDFVVPVRFITLDTDFLTEAALLALLDCCLALNCAVCFTGKVLVCDDDLVEDVVWGLELILVRAALAAPENRILLDLAFNNVKPNDWHFVLN